ncbi:MAG: hypothetical protein KF784_03745 [Fimbriimonadaceae bacterium]|nr:hypothetical protein [Fimbriimonadaceae bacterium]
MKKHVAFLITICAVAISAAQSYGDGAWFDEKWTADEKPYQEARLLISKMKSDTKVLKAYVEAQSKVASRSTSKAIDVYRWACSALTLANQDYDFFLTLTTTSDAFERFRKIASPKSYEYSRVRLLYIINVDFPHQEMRQLAERMLKKDDKDLPVIKAFLRILQPQINESDWKIGKNLVQVIEDIEPDSTSSLASVGYFYYKRWMKTRDEEMKSKVIKYYGSFKAKVTNEKQKKIADFFLNQVKGSK